MNYKFLISVVEQLLMLSVNIYRAWTRCPCFLPGSERSKKKQSWSWTLLYLLFYVEDTVGKRWYIYSDFVGTTGKLPQRSLSPREDHCTAEGRLHNVAQMQETHSVLVIPRYVCVFMNTLYLCSSICVVFMFVVVCGLCVCYVDVICVSVHLL